MIAILILAGRSTRFWPLSEKSFFPMGGTTLAEEQVRRLKKVGIKHILVVAGKHNRSEAAAAFPTLTIVTQKDLDLGMRGALLSALPRCGDESVMVVSANDVIDVSAYKDLLRRTKKMQAGLILAQKVSSHFPGGYLTVKGKRITGIVEKPEPGKEPSDLVNIVAHVHASGSALLKALKKVKPSRDDGYEMALAQLFRDGVYEAVAYEGSWQAVKYPWHLLSLLPTLLPASGKPKIHATATIHKTAVIEGPVIIGKNVKVLAHASVIGPCTIGDGTIVANNALVRGSSVGKNCVIGYSTEIARSILGENVWTHMNYVGDSVIGSDIAFGAGATTGNLRLDEGRIYSVVRGEKVDTQRTKFGCVIGDGCRIGAAVVTNPGVKIGRGTFVCTPAFVSGDIGEGKFVTVKNGELDIRDNRVRLQANREEYRKQLS